MVDKRVMARPIAHDYCGPAERVNKGLPLPGPPVPASRTGLGGSLACEEDLKGLLLQPPA